MVSATAENSKGVKFEELALGKDGEWDLLVLITDVKDRVRDGGDISCVHGFEFFIGIR